MKPLNDAEKQYWHDYLKTLKESERPIYPFVEASYAGNKDVTDALLQLCLNGKKVAGSSIAEDFLSAGDPLPKVGNYWIYLNSRSEPSCILLTEKVVTNKFKDVPIEIALAEGESDLSLDHWKTVHKSAYSPFLSKWGIRHIDEATVVTEFFKIVHI